MESTASEHGGLVDLLERERELGSIGDWVASANGGRGRLALILAGAGLGKTALLEAAAALGAEKGLRVLSARGGELEREMPFGVTRQLLEGVVRELATSHQAAVLSGAAAPARSLLGLVSEPVSSGDPLGLVRALFWLVSNLSDAGPLLLMIDDLHWCDPQSARWLSYLATRVKDLPVLVLAASRADGTDRQPLLSVLLQSAAGSTINLGPLGVPAVSELVRAQFGHAGDRTFVEACHRAGGGNPFFVIELLRAAAADGLGPTAENAVEVGRLGPPEVARSILMRVGRLGPSAYRMASAVAVLGPDAELGHVAELSDLSAEEALSTWDALGENEILQPTQPLEFIHPIVQAAVYGELAPGERTRWHRRAANLLVADGASPERVAAHALACEPAGDSKLVGWLRAAATHALGAGAPDAAAAYLERALREPAPVAIRPRLRFELGMALIQVDVSRAASSLGQAAASAPDPSLRMLAHRWSGYALAYAGATADATREFDRAAELAGDPELELQIVSSRDMFAAWWPDDPEREARQVEVEKRAVGVRGDTPGERRALAVAAIHICLTGSAPSRYALDLVERAASGGVSFADPEGNETAGAVGTVRFLCDDPRPLVYPEAWREAARKGQILQAAGLRAAAAQAAFRRGALLDAEVDARAAWEIHAPLGDTPTTMYWWTLTPLIEVLIARGLTEEASELAASTDLNEAKPDVVIFPWPAVVRGELALAQGQTGTGIALLVQAGEWLEQHGFSNPAYIPWRALAAPALAMQGRRDQAEKMIAVAVDRARLFGAPWALGMALRVAGVVEQGPRGIKLLREAVAVLEPSVCRLEHARALLELGATLRRANRRAEARDYLRSALELSDRCGAAPLTVRAKQELIAAGYRPRRTMLSGVESLTASERRIAELAASGLSNREIAQQLFVTRKTVETHLGHVYSKLGVSGRDHLGAALG